MTYIHTTTLTQHTESEIRALNPNTSFASPFVPPDEYAYVFPAPVPSYDSLTQYVRQIAPELTANGNYEQRWEVVDLDAEVAEANQETQRVASILSQITAMEATVTKRRLREAINSVEGEAWLADVDAQIAALRAQL